MSNLTKLNTKLNSLVIFRSLLEDKVLKLLQKILSQEQINIYEQISDYAEFASALFKENINLTEYIWDCVLSYENLYVQKYARKEPLEPMLEESLRNELEILEEVSRLTAADVIAGIGYEGFLPEWETSEKNFYHSYRELLKNISTIGYGIYYKHHVFSINDGRIIPVKNPDLVSLSDLKGYEMERKNILDNTIALLEGKPSANVLLYGDAGTGKSSTVKAIANEFRDKGLRLVEVRKNQMLEIPGIIQILAEVPLKFILFIDDLSFAQNNEEIGVLKAILEGTSIRRSQNIVIYATSNRRHLVRETFEDRAGSDIHVNETIQEQMSLSERFGLAVNFSKPSKEKYLMIVRKLAKDYNVKNMDELELKAEKYALERGGRSPRVARQFVEYLKICE